jgi:hypothetical protein
MHIDWADYQRVHAERRNLLIHIVAVPLFVGSILAMPVCLVRGNYGLLVICIMLVVLALQLESRGHTMERQAPRPFSGSTNFLYRLFREQFIIFPVFLVSGRWWQQLSDAKQDVGNKSRG